MFEKKKKKDKPVEEDKVVEPVEPPKEVKVVKSDKKLSGTEFPNAAVKPQPFVGGQK